MPSLSTFLKRIVTLVTVAVLCLGCSSRFYLSSVPSSPWQVVALSTQSTLLDISFTRDPMHGWLVGSNNAMLETTDGGKTWQDRTPDFGEQKFRLTSVSFAGDEGWVVGQPSLMLHTLDGGQSWSIVPLSSRLPGAPNTITALGTQSAEMTTDVGAIYQTQDGGLNWKAMVQAAVGVTRNISRSVDGAYVAVSSKGSFYSVWEPGLEAWIPHNRNSSRRVQNMGFAPDGRLWMLARGGQVQFTKSTNIDEWEEAQNPEAATSWGLLDLAYRTPNELWITGGSGNLLCSLDGGKTWLKDRTVEDVPSNLYKIVFASPDQGFILGQQGTVLRYQSQEGQTA